MIIEAKSNVYNEERKFDKVSYSYKVLICPENLHKK